MLEKLGEISKTVKAAELFIAKYFQLGCTKRKVLHSNINVEFMQLFYLDIKLKVSPGHLSRDKTFNSLLVSYVTKSNHQNNWTTSRCWEIGQSSGKLHV